MTLEDFKVGDRVRYKVGQEQECLTNGHIFGQIYTISHNWDRSVQFEEPHGCCMKKRLELVKEHRHHDLIVAWAKDPKGISLQCRSVFGHWHDVHGNPTWESDVDYRIKPKMRDVTRYNWVIRIATGGYFVTGTHYSVEEIKTRFGDNVICKIEETEETQREEIF